MKKYCALMLVLCVVFAFVSCGEDEEVELESYISFTATGGILEDAVKKYSFGDNAESYAQQSGATGAYTLTLKAHKTTAASSPYITITIPSASNTWASGTGTTHPDCTIDVCLDGLPTYSGGVAEFSTETADVTITFASSVAGTHVEGKFKATVKHVTSSHTLELDGTINLVRIANAN